MEQPKSHQIVVIAVAFVAVIAVAATVAVTLFYVRQRSTPTSSVTQNDVLDIAKQKDDTLPSMNSDQVDRSGETATDKNGLIKLESSSQTWQVGQSYTVTLLSTDDNDPVFTEVKLKYDPSVLTVTNVEKGGIWDKTNILEAETDAANGYVSMAFGKSPDASSRVDSSVGVVTFEVVDASSSNTSIMVAEGSSFTYMPDADQRDIQGPELQVSLE